MALQEIQCKVYIKQLLPVNEILFQDVYSQEIIVLIEMSDRLMSRSLSKIIRIETFLNFS